MVALLKYHKFLQYIWVALIFTCTHAAKTHAAPEIIPNHLLAASSLASISKANTNTFERPKISPSLYPDEKKFAAVIVDANTGQVLFHQQAEEKRYPASLTKMMTLYLLFDALKRKQIRIDGLFNVSKKAAGQPPTNIRLKASDRIEVELAIKALIVRSANDVAMVVAENLGGSQAGFAKKMNKKASELGMDATHFINPSGLPDTQQISTAFDMARMSIALRRDFPEYYHYFNISSFKFRGKTYKSHNKLIGAYPGVDGLKTGYIRASGFNLATSVKRGNYNLVAVVMGGKTGSSRDQIMVNLLNHTFTRLATNDNAHMSATPTGQGDADYDYDITGR